MDSFCNPCTVKLVMDGDGGSYCVLADPFHDDFSIMFSFNPSILRTSWMIIYQMGNIMDHYDRNYGWSTLQLWDIDIEQLHQPPTDDLRNEFRVLDLIRHHIGPWHLRRGHPKFLRCRGANSWEAENLESSDVATLRDGWTNG